MRWVLRLVVPTLGWLFLGGGGAPAQEATAPESVMAFAPVGHIEREGTGPIELVLIPEVLGDWTSWRAFMERNADTYTMVAVTLPGFGGTAPPSAPEQTALIADDRMLTPWTDNAVAAVLDVIEREGLERPVVVGHGYGALIGYEITLEHPDKISGLVAVDGAPAMLIYTKPLPIGERTGIVRTRLLPQFTNQDDEAWSDRVRHLIASGVRDEGRADELLETAGRTARGVATRYMVEMYGYDATDRLQEIFTPVLAVAAAGDVPTARVRGAERLRATWYNHVDGLRDLELVFVEGARHFVMDDEPGVFDNLVARFVDRLEPGDVE